MSQYTVNLHLTPEMHQCLFIICVIVYNLYYCFYAKTSSPAVQIRHSKVYGNPILPPPRIQFSLVKYAVRMHTRMGNLLSPVLQGMIQRIQNANNGQQRKKRKFYIVAGSEFMKMGWYINSIQSSLKFFPKLQEPVYIFQTEPP